MSNPTVKIHPLAELIGQCLFSVETVDVKEQRKMVRRAAKEAAKWHDDQVLEAKVALYELWRGITDGVSMSDMVSCLKKTERILLAMHDDRYNLDIQQHKNGGSSLSLSKKKGEMPYEYKCVLTVDQIPDFSTNDQSLSLQADLDILAKEGWEAISCVLIDAKNMSANQICWHTVAKRRKNAKN